MRLRAARDVPAAPGDRGAAVGRRDRLRLRALRMAGAAGADARRPVRAVAARADAARRAAWIGFAFGIGLFGAGVSWVYVALSTLRRHAGGAGGDRHRRLLRLSRAVSRRGRLRCARGLRREVRRRALALAAASWTLAEWLRGWLLSGFRLARRRLRAGRPRPLAGFAPLGGVFLVTLAVAAIAALLVLGLQSLERRAGSMRCSRCAAIALVVGASIALSTLEWSRASRRAGRGEPRAGQHRAGRRNSIPRIATRRCSIYAELARTAKGRLIVLPESALPMFADEVTPEYVTILRDAALRNGGDLCSGSSSSSRAPSPDEDDRYFNSVVSIGSATAQLYASITWCRSARRFPARPCSAGSSAACCRFRLPTRRPAPRTRQPFAVAGERVAVNICYEDAFGAELIARAADATLLVNFTNDAWYGRSLAAEQHEQIATMRALETGATDAARHQYRHHVDHRPSRARAWRGCRGSPAAFSKAASPAEPARHLTCASATRWWSRSHWSSPALAGFAWRGDARSA